MTPSVDITAVENIRSKPSLLAVSDESTSLSWLALFQGALRVVELLHHHGVQPQQHVAIWMHNRREFYEVLLGSLLAGVWLTPVNTHLTRSEIDYVLEDSGAKLVFTDQPTGHFSIPHIGVNQLENGTEGLTTNSHSVYRQVKQLMDGPAGGYLMYTSGTTGRPKGVMRNPLPTVRATLAAWSQMGRSIGLDGTGVHLVTGPAYHAAPGLYALYDLLNGASLVIMTRWEPEQCLRLIEQWGVSHTHLVPTMFVRLLRARESFERQHDLSSLSLVLHGAAPIAAAVKRQMTEWWGEVLVEYWGGSESGIITRVDTASWLAHPGTVGKALEQFEVTVRNDDFFELPTGEIGTLYARKLGVSRPFCYYNDAAKTRSSYHDDWFTLGDMGWLDSEGYVYLADRRSNLIISGGVNIYPAEVEGVLLEHASVADVAVVGVPDAEWGQRVHAFVQAVDASVDGALFIEALRQYAGTRLAKFKIPRSFELRSELPRADSGKLYLNRLNQGEHDHSPEQ